MKHYLHILPILILNFVAHAQFPEVIWDRSGAGEQSRYGAVILALGDQNNDDFADFAVYAGGWGDPGQINEEVIEFFHGGNPPSTIPYMSYTLDPDSFQAGIRFTSIGDVNGDGFEDWQMWTRPILDPDSYRVNFYWGGPDADFEPDFVLKIERGEGDVDDIGDFNGDGFDDFYRYFYLPLDYSEIYFGGNPPDLIPDLILHSPEGMRYLAWPDAAGDINGDGYSDFISGDPNENQTYIFLGGANPDTFPAYIWSDFYSSNSAIVPSLNADGYGDMCFSGYPQWTVNLGGEIISQEPSFAMDFVASCTWNRASGIGDINNDGYNDFAAIDDGCNNLWGTLAIYLGHPWLNPDPAIVIQGRTGVMGLIGIFTSTGLGDVNGDGVDDFAIGAFNSNFDGWRGRAVVVSGDPEIIVGADPYEPYVPQTLNISIYPNPFNAETTFYLELPEYVTEVQLTVFNLLGQSVSEAIVHPSGLTVSYSYSAQNLPSGVYLLKVSTGMHHNIQKFVVLK